MPPRRSRRSWIGQSLGLGEAEEALGSEAKGGEVLYGVGFGSANLLKMSVVTAAAMLAICVLALVETTNKAGGPF